MKHEHNEYITRLLNINAMDNYSEWKMLRYDKQKRAFLHLALALLQGLHYYKRYIMITRIQTELKI